MNEERKYSKHIGVALIQGDEQRSSRRPLHRSAYMPLAGYVFCQQDVSCIKNPVFTAADLNLH